MPSPFATTTPATCAFEPKTKLMKGLFQGVLRRESDTTLCLLPSHAKRSVLALAITLEPFSARARLRELHLYGTLTILSMTTLWLGTLVAV